MLCREVGLTSTIPITQIGGLQIEPVYFSPIDGRDDTLQFIDNLWRSEDLFNGSINLEDYLGDLENYLRLTKGKELKIPDARKQLFINKVSSIATRHDLSLYDRAIISTQAFELALIGIDCTPILERINLHRITRSPRYQDNTIGHREELLATWYLAKFIYHQDTIACINIRNSLDLLSCCFDGKKPLHKKEVDIVTSDALVSVKIDSRSSLVGQISDLFFIYLFSDPRDKIKRIILIQGSRNYENHEVDIGSVLRQSREKIFSTLGCPNVHEKLFDNLSFEVYFIPPVNNISMLRNWIKKQYEMIDGPTYMLEILPVQRPGWIDTINTNVAC